MKYQMGRNFPFELQPPLPTKAHINGVDINRCRDAKKGAFCLQVTLLRLIHGLSVVYITLIPIFCMLLQKKNADRLIELFVSSKKKKKITAINRKSNYKASFSSFLLEVKYEFFSLSCRIGIVKWAVDRVGFDERYGRIAFMIDVEGRKERP